MRPALIELHVNEVESFAAELGKEDGIGVPSVVREIRLPLGVPPFIPFSTATSFFTRKSKMFHPKSPDQKKSAIPKPGYVQRTEQLHDPQHPQQIVQIPFVPL